MIEVPSRNPRIKVAGASLATFALTLALARRQTSVDAPTADEPVLATLDGLDAERVTLTTDDGAAIEVVVAGADGGTTVVLSHCWMGVHTMWAAVAHSLVADGYRVVLYDQRGHGASTVGSDLLTTDRLGSDLLAVLDAVGATDAVLVGHSMGGMAIQGLVATHPEVLGRIRGLVLVATAARFSRLTIPRRLAHRIIGDAASTRLAARSPGRVRRAFGPGAGPAHFQVLHDSIVATPGSTRADCLVAISAMEYRDRLGQVSVPTRVVVGSHDRFTTPARSRALTDLISGAEMTFLDGIGHMVPLEAPEAVVAAVAAVTAVDRTPKPTASPRLTGAAT